MLEARSEYRESPEGSICYANQSEPGSFWFYAPNKGAPIAFAILFAVSGFLHAYQSSYVVFLSSRRTTDFRLVNTGPGK